MSKPRILIINSCSKSKLVSHESQPHCNDLRTITDRESQKKKFSDILTAAGDLYTGQQALSIKKAVNSLKEKHDVDYYIISAGFGFVHESELLPPYECSFSNLKKGQIKEMAKNLLIDSDIKQKIRDEYDLIYLALGKDYFTALDDISYLESKSSLLVHFNKKLKTTKQSVLVDDYQIVNRLSKTNKKIFRNPLGALIASKGTILENYAIDLYEKHLTILDIPFSQWIASKIKQLPLLEPTTLM